MRPSALSGCRAGSAVRGRTSCALASLTAWNCRQRVVKLYGAGRYFLCRHCYRLAHASQSEGALDRALRRVNKMKQRLGGEPGLVAPFPPKPKGMWGRTYQRLREQAFDAEMLAEEAFALGAERLLGRIDDTKQRGY